MFTKVAAGGIGGTIMVIVSWVLKEYAGVDLPTEVVAELAVLIGMVAGWLVPESEVKLEAYLKK